MAMTRMPKINASRVDAALLGMCCCYRCNPADPRLQSAGINTGWFREQPNVPAKQLKGGHKAVPPQRQWAGDL